MEDVGVADTGGGGSDGSCRKCWRRWKEAAAATEDVHTQRAGGDTERQRRPSELTGRRRLGAGRI